MVDVSDAINHLDSHEELYWEVLFPITTSQFVFPIYGYIHLSGQQVKYLATIKDIILFESKHYQDKELSQKVKPERWIKEWKENIGNCRQLRWKNVLVMTKIESFQKPTCEIEKFRGGLVTHPPQGYVRVISPR
jgi:hypothetical protein